MKGVLNHHTRTLHKPRTDATTRRTRCGALAHVPESHVRSVAGEELGSREGFDRCGRCFADSGGY